MMAKRKSRSKSRVKRVKVKQLHQLAHYAFLAGIVIAIIAGLFRNVLSTQALMTTLVILGLLVGLFNLTAKETNTFLLAAVGLMLAGIVNLGLIPGVGPYLRSILSNIVVFVVPAAIIVSLKTVWQLASD